MIEHLFDPVFWVGLGEIVIVNIVLSGDNAVVIALAARSLPRAQQKLAVAWGSVAAIVMRVALTVGAVELLRLPYLKLVGGVLLLWIAVQLLITEDDGKREVAAGTSMMTAIRTILIADLVMSLDNVLGVAAAAKGNTLLLVLGLAISIPLIIFGSSIMLRLMNRFPAVIVAGAAILGWVAGEMMVADPVLIEWVSRRLPWIRVPLPFGGHLDLAAVGGALLVITAGKLYWRRVPSRPHRESL